MEIHVSSVFVIVQLLSHVQLFATPWTAARQASLSFANSQSLLKLMSIGLMMPSNHLILLSPSPPALLSPDNKKKGVCPFPPETQPVSVRDSGRRQVGL